MSRVPWWYDAPEVWDTLVLAGTPMPGIATVEVQRARKVDVKGARGTDGAEYTLTGYEPATVSIELTMWDKDTFDRAAELLEALGPGIAKAKAAKNLAVDISHPATQLGAPITAIVITDTQYGMPNNGQWAIKMSATEYLPAKIAKTKNIKKAATKAATPAGEPYGPPPPPPPNALSEGAERVWASIQRFVA